MKVSIKNLPEGYKVVNGKVVKVMKDGGFYTGDQRDFGLVTFPTFATGGGFDPSSFSNYLGAVPREEANLEAEKGETALTDLNNDGKYELYNIGGERHSNGGTPLNLPAQSFIFSDTASMRLSEEDLNELGLPSSKRITPATASKKFELNKYIAALSHPDADRISIDTNEDMIQKNKEKLSHLSFLQEKKKDFEDGVPMAAFPFIQKMGIDPLQFSAAVNGVSKEKAELEMMMSLPPEQRERIMMLRQFTNGVEEGQGMEEEPEMRYGGDLYRAQVGVENRSGFDKDGKPVTIKTTEVPADYDPKDYEAKTAEDYSSVTDFWTSDEFKPVREASYKAYVSKEKADGRSPMSFEKFNNTFLEFQKQNYDIKTKLNQEDKDSEDWDTRWKIVDGKKVDAGKNWKYNETAEKLGHKPLSVDEIKAAQNVYISLRGLQKIPQFKELMSNTNLNFEGVSDDQTFGESISPADGVWGNTTNRQLVTLKKQPVPPGPTKKEEMIPVKPGPDVPDFNKPGSPEFNFWAQDQMALNNAYDVKMDLKKYYPWVPQYETQQIEPLFKDETRELAALGEAATTGAGVATAFAGPQRAAAILAKSQGILGSQIANTQNSIQDYNVNLANTVGAQNAQLRGRTEELNKAQQKDLYDKTVITDQAFDNAKRMANAEITKQMQNAWTNRANTYNLNSLFPQFDIDPTTGGMIDLVNPKEFYKSRVEDPKTKIETYINIMNELNRRNIKIPELTGAALNSLLNVPQPTSYAEDPSIMAAMMAGGYQTPMKTAQKKLGGEQLKMLRMFIKP